MGIERRDSARILYPFVPSSDALDVAWLAEAVKDVRLAVDGAVSGTVPNPVAEYGVDKPRFGVLYDYSHAGGIHAFVFHTVVGTDVYHNTFEVPDGAGIVRVDSVEGRDAFLIVNRGELVSPTSSSEGWLDVPLEVEPGCCHWSGSMAVTKIRFYQEYRESNPELRPSSEPDSLVASLTGPSLRLADGYNCRLSYDEETGTLYIEGGPGLGLGLPDGIPWDSVGSSGRAVYSLERYGNLEDFSVEESVSCGSELPLIVDVMAETAGFTLTVRLDGATMIDSTIPVGGWERMTLGTVAPGTHSLTVDVSGGSSYWGLRLHVGLPPIRLLNGLNVGGNVDIEAEGNIGVLVDGNGLNIRMTEA